MKNSTKGHPYTKFYFKSVDAGLYNPICSLHIEFPHWFVTVNGIILCGHILQINTLKITGKVQDAQQYSTDPLYDIQRWECSLHIWPHV